MTDLTDRDLQAAAERHDDTINEGGEGYNPYRSEIERREREARRQQPQTREDRRASIVHTLSIMDCSSARESGTYDADRVAALRADLAEIDTETQSEFAAEWTLEITRERRAAWNRRVRADEFGADGRIDNAAICAVYKDQGWDLSALKRAINLHGIKSERA